MPQKMIQSIYHFHSKEGINMNKIYKVIWSKASTNQLPIPLWKYIQKKELIHKSMLQKLILIVKWQQKKRSGKPPIQN